MIELTNQDLLMRLRDPEDHFTERKTFNDRDGWLKTVVAFANSAPIGWPAILFIGITSKGAFEAPGTNLDELQKKLSGEIDRAYPPIYHVTRAVTEDRSDGKQCLAVLIPGSPMRPHFSGKAYVRVGSQSREASEDQFEELITQRNGKARTILEWKGKTVTLEIRNRGSSPMKVLGCNPFYGTFENVQGSEKTTRSIPLTWIEIGYDHANNRLTVITEPFG